MGDGRPLSHCLQSPVPDEFEGLSNPASLIYTQHTKEKSGLTNPPKSGIPKRNTRAQSATRQSTRSKKKQKRSSSALPPTTEGQKKIHLGQDEPQNVASGSPQSQFNSFAGSTYQSTSGLPSSFLPYQVTQHIAAPHQRPSNPVHDQDLPELYLSRIKDATRVPSVPSQGNSIVHDQSYVRPHYVVARRDSLPEAKRQG